MLRNMNKQRMLQLIEKEYALLKKYERGDCYGANHQQLQPNIHGFIAVINRFYIYIEELSKDSFSVEELARIDDCKRAIDRESQNNSIEDVIRVLMYDVEDVMRIVKTKQYDNE